MNADTFSKAEYRGDGGPGKEFGIVGCGEGPIFAYLRRSAEDRTSRPLHVQQEVVRKYAAERLPSHKKAFQKLAKEEENRTEKNKEKTAQDKAIAAGFGGEINEYFVDNGVSASLPIEQRKGLKALFERLTAACSLGDEAHLIIYDVSRLARSDTVGTDCRSRLEKMGVQLHLAQSRVRVDGNVEEMLFGITLKMAESERTQTISRIKTAFKYKKDWDPRKSYGWEFVGKKVPPRPIAEEQAILEEMRGMYEKDGMRVAEIAAAIQKKHGPRRERSMRKKETTENPKMESNGDEKHQESENTSQYETTKDEEKEKRTVAWKGEEVSFLAKKHRWTWGGEKTMKQFEAEILAWKAKEDETGEILFETEEASKNSFVDRVFERFRGDFVDGVRVNKAMIRNVLLIEDWPVWKRKAIMRTVGYLKKKKFSNDDIVQLLNEEAPRMAKKRKDVSKKESIQEESKKESPDLGPRFSSQTVQHSSSEEECQDDFEIVAMPWNRKSVWNIIQMAQKAIDRENEQKGPKTKMLKYN